MTLISILVAVLIVCVLIWGTRSLTAAFGVGEPLSTVILVVVVLICLILLLRAIGLTGGILPF